MCSTRFDPRKVLQDASATPLPSSGRETKGHQSQNAPIRAPPSQALHRRDAPACRGPSSSFCLCVCSSTPRTGKEKKEKSTAAGQHSGVDSSATLFPRSPKTNPQKSCTLPPLTFASQVCASFAPLADASVHL